jgi:hypothetical protein
MSGRIGPKYLLDTLAGQNATAAYSLRRLKNSYNGAAIRVRRSNDNSEIDIGFDQNGELNESDLTSFVGVNNGFVTTWYDQTSSGNPLLQVSTGQQPIIVSTGVVNKQNNKPSINFIQASSTILVLSNSSLFQQGPFTFTAVIGTHGTGGSQDFFGTRSGSSGWSWLYRTTPRYAFAGISFGEVNNPISAISQHLIFLTRVGGINFMAFNSTYTSSGSVGLNTGTNFAIGYGGAGGGQGYLNGNFYELIAYSEDKSSNRLSIESDINNYYKIY